MRKTKIVCTIGPASSSEEMLAKLAKAGMDVARLNFSHGSHQEHEIRIETIRRLARKLGRPIGIMQDLSGPKIRCGKVAKDRAHLRTGQEFTFTSREVTGDTTRVTLPHPELLAQAKRGATIFVDDARLQFRVLSNDGLDVVTRVIVGGQLGSHKGVTIPGAKLSDAAVTDKDFDDLGIKGASLFIEKNSDRFIRASGLGIRT